MQRVWLFVYGTLKRGFSNHQKLRGAVFEREAQTAPGFELRALGSYPGLTFGTGCVRGELFAVEDSLFAELDRFEGPGFLRTPITLENGETAHAYLLRDPSVAPQAIADGVWRESS